MNEHAGASCALSALIVGIFAILLHDKDRPPPAPTPRPPSAPTTETAGPPRKARGAEVRRETALIAPPPSRKRPELGPASRTPPRASTPKLFPPSIVRRSSARREAPKAEVKSGVEKKAGTSGIRGLFTVVESGESLADVAVRVYGSASGVESLWKANRDQLARPDTPLARGTLLRTP